jgi:uncharacterized protein YndB with AHSA1/START domain
MPSSSVRIGRAQDATLRNLEILGEAVKPLPGALTALHPEVAWENIAGFRDFLAHAYFGEDDQIVWDIIATKLEPLEAAVRTLLCHLPRCSLWRGATRGNSLAHAPTRAVATPSRLEYLWRRFWVDSGSLAPRGRTDPEIPLRHPFLAFAILSSLGAQAPAPAALTDPFAAVRFLVGEWRGEGGGKPGQSSGEATFRFEVEGKVLVRRNHADSGPASGKPAFHHEDLMTVFAEGGQLKALYLDNEEHVIRYLVAKIPEGVTFTSEPGPGPRFRLTYLRKAESLVSVRFEFAPPGKPEAFSTYIEAALRKVK